MIHLKKSLINKSIDNPCLRDILILVLIGLVIGIYLILTTVVVSRDSVAYLHRAQWLQDNPAEILAGRPSGYEILILLSYRIFYAITGNSTIRGWIWAAQSLTLLCKVLAIVALYLTGCLITNRRNSFWGCLILLFLPEPAHWGSGVLREWPYLFLITLSLLSLLYGIRKNKIWPFALTGVFAGIGYLIRLEGIQLVLLGLFVLLLLMLKPPKHYTRPKILIGSILLIAGFAGPVLIYAGYSGQINNNYLKHYIEKVIPGFHNPKSEEVDISAGNEPDTASEEANAPLLSENENTPAEQESVTPVVEATSENAAGESLPTFAYELFKDTGELLVWFYLPFWTIGIYTRLRDKTDPLIRWIIVALILLGIGMILMRYFYKEAIVTQRWVLPLVALTVFYIYSGIEQVGMWIERKKSPHLQTPQKWGRILVAAGILICLMKVTEPLGSGKRTYLEAADWIAKNSQKTDWFYTYDRRIPFYAERGYIEYLEKDGFDLEPYAAKGLIIPSDNKRAPDDPSEGLILEACFGLDDEKEQTFYIYRYEQN